MKNLIIIIGTILLGAFIVNSLVLGDDHSLKSTASDIMKRARLPSWTPLTSAAVKAAPAGCEVKHHETIGSIDWLYPFGGTDF